MPTPKPDLDAARRLLVERSLTRDAFQHLTVDAFMTLSFDALGPTKALLKRFFSTEPWDAADADALADVVGPGEGAWRRQLDPDLTLEYGWEEGRFGITIGLTAAEPPSPTVVAPAPAAADALAASFDGPVVPEATPNPRTIRFHIGNQPPARAGWYESSAAARAADDPGVARLASGFDEVANILVGADFVAVGLRRPADWEQLLVPMLEVLTKEFASTDGLPEESEPPVTGGPSRGDAAGRTGPTAGRKHTRLDEAWRALGSLHPGEPADLAALEDAATGDDPFRRQVAANLLREAEPGVAASRWADLVHDPARSVRRATVEAMVDAAREHLRPLLEEVLADADPWVRWKALRGLVELGPSASRDAIRAHADDPDFRVRLEVTAALRAGGPVPGPGREGRRAGHVSARFAALIEAFLGRPGVEVPDNTGRRRFGSDTLKVNGSIFAMISGGQLVVKLPSERVDAVIASGMGSPFDGGKGGPMKEWVTVTADDDDTWRALAAEALQFVGSRSRRP